jgi:hypothetical protein
MSDTHAVAPNAPNITGLKRDKIVHALAAGQSLRSISKNLSHSPHTVMAVRQSDAQRIATVKTKLARMFDTLCERSIRRANKTVKDATYAQACVGAGISAQRAMELRGELQSDRGLTINLLNLTGGSA